MQNSLAVILGRIALGEVPREVTQTLRSCEVAALPKGNNDVRPVLDGPRDRLIGCRGRLGIPNVRDVFERPEIDPDPCLGQLI